MFRLDAAIIRRVFSMHT